MDLTTDKTPRQLFGILNLDKPTGLTSRHCVDRIQRSIRPVKVGHAGTLDPIASGVLLLLIGPAVRLTDDLHRLDKEYEADFQLGISSASADTETEMFQHPGALPTLHSIQSVLGRFIGTISQTPPIYSAVQIRGQRAYRLARAGKSIEMPSRSVRIDCIEITHYQPPHLTLKVTCGTGTYIRALGRDIAQCVGSDAVMTKLTRTRVGPFRQSASYSLDGLQSPQDILDGLKDPQVALPHMIPVNVSDDILERVKNGQKVTLPGNQAIHGDRIAALNQSGELKAVLVFDGHRWQTEMYFPETR